MNPATARVTIQIKTVSAAAIFIFSTIHSNDVIELDDGFCQQGMQMTLYLH